MRFEGTLKAWNDERGFGFIKPARGDGEVFVHIRAFNRRAKRPAEWDAVSVLAIPAFIALYVGVSLQWSVSPLWAAGYAMASIVTFFSYAFDKSAATRGTWRTSEGTLLGLGLIGGWPRALLAQKCLRHKSSKESFRRAFWATVFVNLAAFVVLNSAWIESLRGQ